MWTECGQKVSRVFATSFKSFRYNIGAIAQLGERLRGTQEVGGSIPPSSTILFVRAFVMKKILLTLMVFGSFGAFAEDKLETAQASNPILIDVRTDAEWNDGYIETAIHIPLDKILQKIEFATESKDQAIYLYCRSGKRSAKAEKSLQSIGYINAKNIGGIKQASSSLQLKITNE